VWQVIGKKKKKKKKKIKRPATAGTIDNDLKVTHRKKMTIYYLRISYI